MNKEKFKETLTALEQFDKKISALYDIGLDLLDGVYSVNNEMRIVFYNYINSSFTKEGIEWIDWFIYESDYGNKKWASEDEILDDPTKQFGAFDGSDPICYDIDSLWGYLETNEYVIK